MPDTESLAVQARAHFSILGPLQLLDAGHPLAIGPRKQRVVLAALLAHANNTVSVDSLAGALWPDTPPRTARKNIQVYISELRSLLSQACGSADSYPPVPSVKISYEADGYVLHASAAQLDSLAFKQRAKAGLRLRHSGDPAAVAQALAAALGLWRGPALDGMREIPLIDTVAQRLDRLYLAVFEDWAEAEVATGGGAGVVEDITGVAAEHPLRERLRILQMTALCQAGRRSEALAVYDELRQSLAHDLGLSPGLAVVTFYQSLLREQEPAAQGSAAWQRPPVPPSLLPRDLLTFTGRAEPTRQLAAALVQSGNRLAVLTGPLGAGKTALAVHAAHQLADAFPDGRFFVRLRGDDGALRRPEDVVSQLMWAVTPRLGAEPVPSGPRAWQHWLAGRRCLVILDDACREQEVRPLLPEVGDSAVIVTARSRLAGLDAAYRLSVRSFSPPEALEFLSAMIGPDRVSADRLAAQEIVAATGSLPLSLRLAAQRLTLLHHVPLADYAARLSGTPALLDELTTGSPAIRARLAEAIGELPEPAHRAVLRLGQLPQPVFTASQATAVLGPEQSGGAATLERLLEYLLEANVLTVASARTGTQPVRYEIPVLVYAYVREIAAVRT